MEARLKKEIAGIKAEMQAEMQEMKQKMEKDIQEINISVFKKGKESEIGSNKINETGENMTTSQVDTDQKIKEL